jgi:hypothetical protein
MDAKEIKREPKIEVSSSEEISGVGDKRYSQLVRMFKEGYISVCIYKNVYDRKTFYDTVICRKIKQTSNGAPVYKRGANLKPSDIPHLLTLLPEVMDFLRAENILAD